MHVTLGPGVAAAAGRSFFVADENSGGVVALRKR
jgi:hypothetical protein